MNGIGEIIRTLRNARKLTQLQLAMRLNVTPQAVGKWERGESEPDLSLLCPIAKALGVTLETLFGTEQKDGTCPDRLPLEQLPEILKSRRTAANLTQSALAEKIGVSKQTVSKWETGVCAPDLDYCRQLCDLYAIPPSQLLTRAADPAPSCESAPSVPPEPSTPLPAKKKNFFARFPVRIAAVFATLVVAVSAVITPLALGASRPHFPSLDVSQGDGTADEEPGGDDPGTQNPSDPPEDEESPGGGMDEELPGGGMSEDNQPSEEIPPVAESPVVYHTLTIYDNLRPYLPDEDTMFFKDEYIEDGQQLTFVWDEPVEPSEEIRFISSSRYDEYLVTGMTYKDGTPVSFPITVTEDMELYVLTEPRWFDWIHAKTYAEKELLRSLTQLFGGLYETVLRFIDFYKDFQKTCTEYPDMPREDVFYMINRIVGHDCFPSDADVLIGGVPSSLPTAADPNDLYSWTYEAEQIDPVRAEQIRDLLRKSFLLPSLMLSYAFLNETQHLEDAVVTAMAAFEPFLSLAHERVTKDYRLFMQEHAEAAPYVFPEIEFAQQA